VSVVDLGGVREVQRLAGLVATLLLRDKLPSNYIGSVWDMETDKEWVSTGNVNRARRFLHSSEGSGGSGGEDFSDINMGNKLVEKVFESPVKGDQSPARKLSVGSQEWGTPPSSPAESIASMETCSEGDVCYVVGDKPTIQDRRVIEALEHFTEEQLAKYPSVQWYLAHIRSFNQKERLGWGDAEIRCLPGQTGGLARRLDLDLTY